MDLYAQNILDRYKEPYYKDKPVKANAINEEVNHSCGDKIEVKLEILNSKSKVGSVALSGANITGCSGSRQSLEPANLESKIETYSFSGVGCAISQASADILGDLIIGKTLEEVLALTKDELFEALGIEISLRRSKCALLGLITVKNAILKYLGKKQNACSLTQ